MTESREYESREYGSREYGSRENESREFAFTVARDPPFPPGPDFGWVTKYLASWLEIYRLKRPFKLLINTKSFAINSN